MKWKELSGEERYRVVEIARKGDVPISEICKSFGVSRQTLYRAMDKADKASMEALEPRKAGRKSKSEEAVKLEEAAEEKSALEKELTHWKMKYEVAKTYLDLSRKYDRGEALDEQESGTSTSQQEKKRRRKKRTKRTKRTKSKKKR